MDDTLVLCSCNDPQNLLQKTKEVTGIVINRLQEKGLVLNTNKSEALLFNSLPRYRQRSPELDDPVNLLIQVGDAVIIPSPSIKYLGVIIDNHLTWYDHIRYAAGKAKAALPTLTAVCTNTFGYSYQARRVMVLGCMLSQFLYCSSVWYHRLPLRTNRTVVLSLQRVACILISRSYRTISTEAALLLANLPPWDLVIIARSIYWQLIHGHKVSNWGNFSRTPKLLEEDLLHKAAKLV